MLAEERRSNIQYLLDRRGTVSIAELAEAFGTSEMTIRRDLDELEARGLCRRIHGGAMSLRAPERPGSYYPTYPQQKSRQVWQKLAIGRAAAQLVRPGDLLAIDSGTTADCVARAVRTRAPLTVITNSVSVLQELHDADGVALISPGGVLDVEGRAVPGGDLTFIGPTTVANLRKLRPKKAFIGATGVSAADGVFNVSPFQAEIKRVLVEIADEAFLVVDHTKFRRVTGFLVCPVQAFKAVITDIDAPAEEVAALRSLGTEVVLVEPAREADTSPGFAPRSVAHTGSL